MPGEQISIKVGNKIYYLDKIAGSKLDFENFEIFYSSSSDDDSFISVTMRFKGNNRAPIWVQHGETFPVFIEEKTDYEMVKVDRFMPVATINKEDEMPRVSFTIPGGAKWFTELKQNSNIQISDTKTTTYFKLEGITTHNKGLNEKMPGVIVSMQPQDMVLPKNHEMTIVKRAVHFHKHSFKPSTAHSRTLWCRNNLYKRWKRNI